MVCPNMGDWHVYMEVSINGDTRGYRIPLNGWFMMENPVKIDDLRDPHLRKPPYYVFIRVLKSNYICQAKSQKQQQERDL